MNQLICKDHNNPLSYISISNKTVQLVCDERILLLQEQSKDFSINDFIYIQKAATQIEFFLNKTTLSSSFPTLFETLKTLSKEQLQQEYLELEKNIQALQNALNKLLQIIKDHINSIGVEVQTFSNQLLRIIKYDEFQQIINSKHEQQLTNYLNPFIQGQISKRIQYLIRNKKQQENHNYSDFLLQMRKESQVFQSLIGYNYEDFLLKDFLSSKLMTPKELKYILEQQKVPQVDLIYRASKKELNLRITLSKIKDKKDLFMIFKNKNNQVFGGYSHQKWRTDEEEPNPNKEIKQLLFITSPIIETFILNPYYRDCRMTQNKQEGIFYGKGPDLWINFDFCGELYYMDKNQSLNIPQQPQVEMQKIIECEIYQLFYF